MNFELLFQKIYLPNEASETVRRTYVAASSDQRFSALLASIENREDFKTIEGRITALATELGLNPYELALTVLCAGYGIMRTRYLQAGLDEQLFWDSFADVTFNAEECHSRYGVWGIFIFFWYQKYFEIKMFRFGRLEYENSGFPIDSFEKGGVTLQRGDHVLQIHIPATGHLLMEDVKDSFARAAAFFGCSYHGFVPFVCSTWILYPPYQHLFKNGSHLQQFADLFEVVRVKNKEQFDEGYLIFGKAFDEKGAVLPQKTSLQRAFSQYIADGGSFGTGYGIHFEKL